MHKGQFFQDQKLIARQRAAPPRLLAKRRSMLTYVFISRVKSRVVWWHYTLSYVDIWDGTLTICTVLERTNSKMGLLFCHFCCKSSIWKHGLTCTVHLLFCFSFTTYQIIQAAAKSAANSCTRGNFSNIKNLSPASERRPPGCWPNAARFLCDQIWG